MEKPIFHYKKKEYVKREYEGRELKSRREKNGIKSNEIEVEPCNGKMRDRNIREIERKKNI